LKSDCYPVTDLPNATAIFGDFLSSCGGTDPNAERVGQFYSPLRCNEQWMRQSSPLNAAVRQQVAVLLRTQNREFRAGAATQANIDRLEQGANAVVTGQQVGLFGGPLLTLLKAATAIRLAEKASRAGHPHVPVFWLASEDHDFDEVNQAVFPGADARDGFETLRLLVNPAPGRPVGDIVYGEAILPLLAELRRCLGENSTSEFLASVYTPAATFSSAFAAFLAWAFREHGLIVIDAATRPFHALAQPTLRAAIEHADEIHAALLDRNRALEQTGYSPQVLVTESSSLLFLIDDSTGVRIALKKNPGGEWSAGARNYSTGDLLAILDATPQRVSPNALLRPVMQDTLLPTSAYIGGPSEIAYFAQSEVVYQRILGRATPILPRFSATLIEPHLAQILEQHGLSLPDTFTTADALAQRLGARAMPPEIKRKLASAGNALREELQALTDWMHAQDQALGHAADTAASKVLYQMNRLRRLSAAFSLQQDQSLRRHADALSAGLFPQGNLQERVLAGAWFLAKSDGSLIDALVENAQAAICGHHALFL
jgi:bacillithiol synthase